MLGSRYFRVVTRLVEECAECKDGKQQRGLTGWNGFVLTEP